MKFSIFPSRPVSLAHLESPPMGWWSCGRSSLVSKFSLTHTCMHARTWTRTTDQQDGYSPVQACFTAVEMQLLIWRSQFGMENAKKDEAHPSLYYTNLILLRVMGGLEPLLAVIVMKRQGPPDRQNKKQNNIQQMMLFGKHLKRLRYCGQENYYSRSLLEGRGGIDRLARLISIKSKKPGAEMVSEVHQCPCKGHLYSVMAALMQKSHTKAWPIGGYGYWTDLCSWTAA